MLEMDDSVIKQLMDTQSQMLNSIQGMQTQTLTIIQQNTAALQGVQLNQNMTPLVQSESSSKAPDIVPFSSFPQATVLNQSAPQITPTENMVSVGDAPAPTISSSPDMVMVNQNASAAPSVAPLNMGPVIPNMPQAPLYTNPGLVSTNLYAAMPGSLNAQAQNTPTGMFREFQNQDMGAISDITNMFIDPRNYQAYSAVGNPLSYLAKRHTDFKGHMASATARQEFTEDTTNAITGNVMNALGVVGQGAADLSGFFIPGGFVASTAIGLGIGAAANVAIGETLRGGQVSQQYEDILRKQAYQFINPSEGMTEYGTVGLSRPERHELGDYLRKLAPEKFLDDTELQQMLAGSLDNKLLKAAGDVETFKKRFSETVDAAKKIMVTMDQSIDEAMNFMGELEQRGIKTSQMAGVAANMKVASSYGYMSASQGANMILGATDAITQGTAINAGDVASTMSQSIAMANIINEEVFASDPRLRQYVKNIGGASEFGVQYDTGVRNYVNQTNMATGIFAPAFKPVVQDDGTTRLELDENEFQRIMFSDRSSQDLAEDARRYTNDLNVTERALFYEQAPTLMNNALDSQMNLGGMAQFVQKMYNDSTGMNLDLGTALRESGMFKNQDMADASAAMATAGADGNIPATILAKSWQNEINTLPPGMLDRLQASYRGFMADTAGDVGSAMQSSISDTINSINMRLENMSDRSSMERLSTSKIDLNDPNQSFTQMLSREELSSYDSSINVGRFNAGMDPLVTYKEMDNFGGVEALTYDEFESIKQDIEDGNFSPAMLDRLSGLAADTSGIETAPRAQYLLDLQAGQAKDSDLERIEQNKSDFYDKQGKSFKFDPTLKITDKDGKQEVFNTSATLGDIGTSIKERKEYFTDTQAGIVSDREKHLGDLAASQDMSSEDVISLRKAIDSGDAVNAKDILTKYNQDTSTVDEIIQRQTDLQAEAKKFEDETSNFTTVSDKFDLVAKAGVNLKEMIENSGLPQATIDAMKLDEVQEDAQQIINKDYTEDNWFGNNSWFETDNDDMSAAQQQELGLKVQASMEAKFTAMSEKDLAFLVESEGGIAAKMNVSADAFKTDGKYDAKKVYAGYLDAASRMEAKPTDTGEEDSETSGSESVDGLAKVISEHETQFTEMIKAFQREIQAAQNARYGNQTSLQ